MLGPGHLSFPIIHPPFHLLSILIYDSIISSALRTHATPSSTGSWSGHSPAQPKDIPLPPPAPPHGWAAGTGRVGSLGQAGGCWKTLSTYTMASVSWASRGDVQPRISPGDSGLHWGTHTLYCERSSCDVACGRRGVSGDRPWLGLVVPGTARDPLGHTSAGTQSQLHGAPAAMSVLLCPSTAAVEGS